MKKDRFLVAILLFIALLVAAALLTFFVGGSTQSYLPENDPESIVHNYALALTLGDFERAYRYVAEGEAKPAQALFRQNLSQRDELEHVGLRIGDVDLVGQDAFVQVTVLHGSSGPFDSGYTMEASAVLQLQDGAWRIKSMPYPYWEYGWLDDFTRP